MTKKEAMDIFASLTYKQQKEVIKFMQLPKFWRSEQMFRETYWWFPMAISALSTSVALIALLMQ